MRRPTIHKARYHRRPAQRPTPTPSTSKGGLAAIALAILGVYGGVKDVLDIPGDMQSVVPEIVATVSAQDSLGNVARFAPVENFERTLTSDPTIATAKGYWPEGKVSVEMSYQSPEEVLAVTFKNPDTQAVLVTFEVDYQNPPKDTLENIFRRKLKDADALASL